MELTTENELSFYDEQGILVVAAKQGDTARKFIFKVQEDISGSSLTFRMDRPDGTSFVTTSSSIISLNEEEITIDTSGGTDTEKGQILAGTGTMDCDIVCTKDDKILSTWKFRIYVEPSPGLQPTIAKNLDYLSQMKTIASSIEGENKIAESWAIGGTGTRTDEDTNNAKYWCDRAQAITGIITATNDDIDSLFS